MPQLVSRPEVVLAEWVSERLPSEQVPDLAIDALKAGCRAPTLAALAGLDKPTRGDVEDFLPAVLREGGLHRPSQDEAFKTLVDETARLIVRGESDPLAGASRIWELWGYSRQPDERSVAWKDLRPFVDLASEYEVVGAESWDQGAAVVEAATALLRRGGLRIGHQRPSP